MTYSFLFKNNDDLAIITIEHVRWTCLCVYKWLRVVKDTCTCILFSFSIRNRLPNHFDDLSYWSDVLLWREQHFRTIIKAYDGTSHAEQVKNAVHVHVCNCIGNCSHTHCINFHHVKFKNSFLWYTCTCIYMYEAHYCTAILQKT